jgi:hypothetical protein
VVLEASMKKNTIGEANKICLSGYGYLGLFPSLQYSLFQVERSIALWIAKIYY